MSATYRPAFADRKQIRRSLPACASVHCAQSTVHVSTNSVHIRSPQLRCPHAATDVSTIHPLPTSPAGHPPCQLLCGQGADSILSTVMADERRRRRRRRRHGSGASQRRPPVRRARDPLARIRLIYMLKQRSGPRRVRAHACVLRRRATHARRTHDTRTGRRHREKSRHGLRATAATGAAETRASRCGRASTASCDDQRLFSGHPLRAGRVDISAQSLPRRPRSDETLTNRRDGAQTCHPATTATVTTGRPM